MWLVNNCHVSKLIYDSSLPVDSQLVALIWFILLLKSPGFRMLFSDDAANGTVRYGRVQNKSNSSCFSYHTNCILTVQFPFLSTPYRGILLHVRTFLSLYTLIPGSVYMFIYMKHPGFYSSIRRLDASDFQMKHSTLKKSNNKSHMIYHYIIRLLQICIL